jgi:hypothetical protein
MTKQCIKDRHMKALAKSSPAAYLVNMCNLVYEAIAPLGSGSNDEDRGTLLILPPVQT